MALHRAVRSIRGGECRQAIVGAVNLLLTPSGYIGFESMGYLSPAGRMASFQSDASGFVRAEGVGAVILKPLRDALEDRNQVYAVIRGTGVSHGGHTVSMTTPNGAGMKAAIRQAYREAGVDPRTVSYVEAHGIAAPLGDAIEMSALKSEYLRLEADAGTGTPTEAERWIGSAKPCTGYAEVASGMVSLIKVAMALRHRVLPGIARFGQAHDNIQLKNSPFRISARNQQWAAIKDARGIELPRRAAINNYGFSGVNAHLVLQEHVPQSRAAGVTGDPARGHLFVLSARTAAALHTAAGQLLQIVESRDDLSLGDIAFTLQRGRDPMAHRMAVVVHDREALLQALRHWVAVDDGAPAVVGATTRTAATVWTGSAPQGATAAADAPSVDAWLGEGRLDALAQHWASGGDVRWERLQGQAAARRVSLPGHPLAPTRCWLPGSTGLSSLHGQETSTAKRPRRSKVPAVSPN